LHCDFSTHYFVISDLTSWLKPRFGFARARCSFEFPCSFAAMAADPLDLPTGEAVFSPYGRDLALANFADADAEDDELCIGSGGSTLSVSASAGVAVPSSSPGSSSSSSSGRHHSGSGKAVAALAAGGSEPSVAALGPKLERCFLFQARKGRLFL